MLRMAGAAARIHIHTQTRAISHPKDGGSERACTGPRLAGNPEGTIKVIREQMQVMSSGVCATLIHTRKLNKMPASVTQRARVRTLQQPPQC